VTLLSLTLGQSTFLDKVIGGDARYTPLNPMPKLAPREGVLPEKKPKKK